MTMDNRQILIRKAHWAFDSGELKKQVAKHNIKRVIFSPVCKLCMPSEDHQKKSAASLPIKSTRAKNFSWINPHWKLWHIKKVSLNGIINRYIYIYRERERERFCTYIMTKEWKQDINCFAAYMYLRILVNRLINLKIITSDRSSISSTPPCSTKFSNSTSYNTDKETRWSIW